MVTPPGPVHKVGDPVHIYSSGHGLLCQARGGLSRSQEREAAGGAAFRRGPTDFA
jgi:hypothetical protein